VPGRRFEQFRGGDEGSVVSVDLDNGICEVIFDGRPTSVPVAMRHLETPAAEPSEQSTTKDTADVTRRLLLPQPSEPSTTRDTARTVQDDVTTGSATLPAGSDDGSSMIGPASAMPRASRPSMPGPESAAGARAFVAAASATQPAEVAPAACGGGAAGLAAQAGWPDPADAFRLDGGLISQSLHGAPVGWLFVQRLAARLDALERRVHVLDGQADPGRSVAVAPGHCAAPQEAGDVAEGLEAGLGRLVTQTETSAALEQRLAELSSQVKAVAVQEASREARCQEFQEQLRLDMQAWCARMGSRGSWRFGAGRNWRPGAADADESMNTTNGMLEEDAEASMQLRDRCEVPSARAAAQAVRAALDRALSGLSRRSGDSGDSHVAWTPDTPRSRRWQATVLCRALRSGLPPGAKAPARPAALALEGPGSSGSSSPSGGLPTPLAAPGARGAPSPPPRPVAETTPVASELEDAAACGPPPRMRRDERRRSSLLSVPEVPTARAPRSRGPSSAHRQPHGVASRLQDDAEGERAARSACERRGLRAPSWQDVGALPGAVDDGAECAGGGRTPARWCGALGRPESQRPPVPPAAAVQPRLGRKYSITVADSSAGGALPLELGRSREVETPPSEGSSRSGSDPPSRGAEVGAAALRRPHPLDSPPARPPLGSRCADGSPRDFVRKLQQKLEREALLRGRASGDACEPPHADGGTRVATACAEGDAAGSDSESHAVDLLLGVLAPDCVDVPLPSPVMMSPRNSSSAQTSRVASRNRSRDTSQNITPGRSPRDAQAHGPEPTGRDSLTFSSMTFSHSSASPPAASSRPSFASSRPSFAASLIGSSRPSLCMATMAACGSSRPSLGAAGCISSRPSLNAGGVSTRPSLNAGASSRPSLNASGSCSSRPSLSAALSQIGSARPSFNATGSGSSRPSLAAALSAASSPRPSLLGAQGEMLCLEEDFKAGETLGAGSYGRVFAAQHRRTGQVVAVKEVFFQPPQAAEAPPSELRALERELALCERLRHHRIVRFLGHEIGPTLR
ncbi:unnamed protein product, partial [Prorocentrum cordatum]